MSEARAMGDLAVLFELAGNADVHRLAAALRRACAAQIDDLVPGERTLLVRCPDPDALAHVRRREPDLSLGTSADGSAREPVTIQVVYDGPDLAGCAQACGISVEAFAARHQAGEYAVGFIGFAPGFAYLLGGDPGLRVPRREDPRPRVPAGSLAVADRYTAIYPAPSPGGWQLIGRTERVMFDPAGDPPALLAPGDPVRFRVAS